MIYPPRLAEGLRSHLSKIVVMFVLTLVSNISKGQLPNAPVVAPPSVASPTAASLGKYSDIPVSFHTGVPEISIPIYTVTEGNLSLPISMNYHSSGIKVDEVASWVGLGWSLHAGGAITRSIIGAPDEGSGRFPTSAYMVTNKGWLKNHGLDPTIKDYCLAHPDGVPPVTGPNTPWDWCFLKNLDVSHGTSDSEPDMFNISMPGYSGKFYFDEIGIPVLQPYADISFKPIYGTYIPAPADYSPIVGWTVTGPDGTKYTFGVSNAVEKTYYDGTGINCCNENLLSSTSWYLTRIENLNNTASITLGYTPEQYAYAGRAGQTVASSYSGNLVGSNQRTPEYLTVTAIDGVRLTSITTSSNQTTVTLVANSIRTDVNQYPSATTVNTQAKYLDKILIDGPISHQSFNLTYSYFQSNAYNSMPSYADYSVDTKRLRLDNIQETSGGTAKPPYAFTYNTTTSLPRRLSLARDHWGYYNGHDNNTGLIPVFDNMAPNVRQYREPDSTKMKAGILTMIQFPMGGTRELLYESHLWGTTVIGGVRVKKIITKDSPSSVANIKIISYDNGMLYAGMPDYFVNKMNNPTYNNIGNFSWIFQNMYTSSPKGSLKTTQGYHIGYSTASIKEPGNGQIRYYYDNFSYPTPTTTYPAAPVQFVPGTGNLLHEESVSESGTVIQSTDNYYFTDRVKYVQAWKFQADSPDQPNSREVSIILPYTISAERRLLARKIETKEGVARVSYYRYSPNHTSPVQEVTYDSKGQRIEHNNVMSADQFVSCSSTPANCLSAYNSTVIPYFNQFTQGVPNVYEQNVVAAQDAYWTCMNNVSATYNTCVINAFSTGSAPDKILATMGTKNVVVPLELKQFTAGTQTGGSKTAFDLIGNQLVPKEVYEYDNVSGQLVRRASVSIDASDKVAAYWKENDNTSSFVWGYGHTQPIAEVKNATPTQIFYTSFEESTTNTSPVAKTGKLSYSAAYTVVLPSPGTYKLSYWSNTGSSWIYNESQVSANTTIGAAGTLIDEVRLHPAGAQMTTYTYDVGVGVTSKTDPNGITSYFQYDEFNRLKVIKDNQGNIVKRYKYNYKK